MLAPLMVATACSAATPDTSPTVPASTIPTSPSTSTTSTVPALEATRAFRGCLADHGIIIEVIPFDARGRPRLDLVMRDVDFADPEDVAALADCSGLLSTGALELSGSPELQRSVMLLLGDFSECVRSHGVTDFPDPIPGYSGIGGPYPAAEIPFADPDLGKAVENCRDRLASEIG